VRNDERVFRCVESVRAAGDALPEADLQIIVVDNDSTSDFLRCLTSLPPEVEVAVEPAIGPFKARNRGVAAATGDAIFLTDAPCVVHSDWLQRGLEGLDQTGADILQGFSGSLAQGRLDQFIQSRYEARFRRVSAGAGVECDTRNLAVKRHVFDRLRFNDRYRRVGDTEFGLVAESLGFRVAYWPAMRVEHEHDTDARIFLAKQVSHGWGAQRLVRELPEARWHGGHARDVGRLAKLARLPGAGMAVNLLIRGILASSGTLQRRLYAQSTGVTTLPSVVVDKLAFLAGHLLYETGAPEPTWLLEPKKPRR
jgi:glycosyltransferase involved in cell wall biosynthesis